MGMVFCCSRNWCPYFAENLWFCSCFSNLLISSFHSQIKLLKLTGRECNKVAHELAQLAKRCMYSAVWRDQSPSCTHELVSLDCKPLSNEWNALLLLKKKLLKLKLSWYNTLVTTIALIWFDMISHYIKIVQYICLHNETLYEIHTCVIAYAFWKFGRRVKTIRTPN